MQATKRTNDYLEIRSHRSQTCDAHSSNMVVVEHFKRK